MADTPFADVDFEQRLLHDGFFLAKSVFSAEWCDAACEALERVFGQQQDAAVSIRSRGIVYAARNLLQITPLPLEVCQSQRVRQLVTCVLGQQSGLVRALFFDKPPGRSWSLPWHQDRTIAVACHRKSERYRKPTTKAGVAHVEAPRDVLELMLTLRLHLDPMGAENGPLEVVVGSHQQGRTGEHLTLEAARGDVLVMRPLLSHRSSAPHPGTMMHRRILHLEFAAGPLDQGFQWRDFIPLHRSH